jgi:manganese transport protein
LISNFLAIILQHLSLKLGIVTGKDLASISHRFPNWLRKILWVMAEVAITACDLAEVIGSAIALNLLFKLPLMVGVLVTIVDVFLLLFLQEKGMRYLEALVISLISVIVASFGIEIFLSQPNMAEIFGGLVPSIDILKNPGMLYIAIGILGATVMPHNLYLHSYLAQARSFGKKDEDKKEAILYSTIDSTLALCFAFVVNCSILILAAAAFNKNGLFEVAEIQDAHKLLSPLLGTSLSGILFAIALLASGHNSTITGTLAGQVVMEGFINLKMKPWMRRLLTRAVAIVPTIIVVWLYGPHGMAKLLVLSQVVLSLQLPFAVIPLVYFTGNKKVMGKFANSKWLAVLSWSIAILIVGLNGYLLIKTFA